VARENTTLEINSELKKTSLARARENELREPIPHIGLCTHHQPRSSIFKRNVIGQTIKTLKTQKPKMAQSDFCGRRR